MTEKKTLNKKSVSHQSKTHKDNKSNNLIELEKKLDNFMIILQKKLTFVKQIMELDFIKNIISSKVVNDTNGWVKSNLSTISKIIGWVMVVFWSIWLLMTLTTIWVLFSFFWGGFFVLLLLNIVYIVISIILWFWLIKMKKWIPFFITLVVSLNLLYFLVTLILFWFDAISSPRTTIFDIVFMIYVLKNKNLFIN